MPTPAERVVVGIVLAGGGSRRFGSDKLVTRLNGAPILLHAVTAVRAVCDRVVVQLPHGVSRPPIDLDGVDLSSDSLPSEGPLAGLADALDLASGASCALVVGGDMPTMVPGVLRMMVDSALEGMADLTVLGSDRDVGPSPLPCVVVRGAFADVRRLVTGGERRLRALLDRLELAEVPLGEWTRLDAERRTLHDVDEPADLGPEGDGSSAGGLRRGATNI